MDKSGLISALQEQYRPWQALLDEIGIERKE